MTAYVRPRWDRRRPARQASEGRWEHTYAAIDLGTNNCRLLVARPTRSGFRVIDAFSRIVRLGEGVSGSGCLSVAAMDRTIEALKICADKMRRRAVDRSRCVATDACRRAQNGAEFLERVSIETGLKLETITAEEEAGLALKGCLPLIQPDARHALVFDIGGGSTEVMLTDTRGGASDMTGWVSLPFGVVNLSERYGSDTLSASVYDDMVVEVEEHLAPFCQRHEVLAMVGRGEAQLLGTSGTVTTLTGVHLGLQRYDRAVVDGAFLDFDDIRVMSDRLRRQDCAARAAHPCIGPERADLVVAGCAILEAICRRWPIGRLRVADRGLREGMLLDLMRDANNESRKEKSPGR
ncbi:MAG: Ppx/GppA phosphatase family protein [Alphaproteobacteria bacterium]|nr:Ppx/GppA phosphatase family protein [Alphaproteobacteria bacterium]